jgi:hypothetical protein
MNKTYSINGTEYTVNDTASGGYTVTESASAYDEEETRYFNNLEEAYEYILNEHVCGEYDPE